MAARSSAGTSVAAYVLKLPFWPSGTTTAAARTFLTQADSPRVDTTKSEPWYSRGTTGTRCGSTALRRTTPRVCTSYKVLYMASLLKVFVIIAGGFR
jgi:hypothetical protein